MTERGGGRRGGGATERWGGALGAGEEREGGWGGRMRAGRGRWESGGGVVGYRSGFGARGGGGERGAEWERHEARAHAVDGARGSSDGSGPGMLVCTRSVTRSVPGLLPGRRWGPRPARRAHIADREGGRGEGVRREERRAQTAGPGGRVGRPRQRRHNLRLGRACMHTERQGGRVGWRRRRRRRRHLPRVEDDVEAEERGARQAVSQRMVRGFRGSGIKELGG